MSEKMSNEYLKFLDKLIKSIETDTPIEPIPTIDRKTLFEAHKRKFKKYPAITGRHWHEDGGYHSEKVWEAIQSGIPYAEDPPKDGAKF